MPKAGKRSWRKRGGAQKRKWLKRSFYKRLRNGATSLVNHSLQPIPHRFICQMKYAEAVTVSTPGMSTYRWRLNSLYDPNYSGGGHQPYGFPQLCGPQGTGLYNRYRVLGCSYVLTATSDTANIAFAALPSNEIAPPISNVSEARENPMCRYATFNPGGTMRMLKGYVDIAKLMGRPKQQYLADDNYQAVYNNNPAEVAQLGVFGAGLNDDPTYNANITYNILLTYTVELFDRHVINTQGI